MRFSASSTGWLRPEKPRHDKEAAPRETAPEPGGRSLRFRLLLTVIVALAPAAFVNIIQGVDRVQQDVSEVRERLVQTARTTASDSDNVLASAEQIARTLAVRPEVRQGTKGCTASLTDALKGFTYFTNLARIDAHGDVMCAATLPPPEQLNASDRVWWSEATRQRGFFVTPQVYSFVARRNVLGGILPLQTDDGRFDGVIAIALDVAWLDFMLHTKQIPKGAVVAVFDPANTMIAANDREIAAQVFAKAVTPASGSSGLLSATGPRGENWSYALASLRGDGTYVGFGMSDSDLFTGTFLRVATDLLLPVLMLGLASFAIWIAADRLVLRWIAYLRRVAAAYARGHYAIRPIALEEAPTEFRILGETFSGMAAAVQDRDRSLRDALAQKSLLIKETHHRVKNNLQIVMSLLSLQAARLHDPAAQNALRQAQARVNALALVHRILHEIENLETVDLKRLLEDLVKQIHEGFGTLRCNIKLELDIVPRQMPSEIAVPLTLFTVEVLTNAFKHAYPADSRRGLIRVSLLPSGEGELQLSVADDGVGIAGERSHESLGIGSRLIQAFAQQIGGTVTTEPQPGGRGTIVSLLFADPVPEMEMAADESG